MKRYELPKCAEVETFMSSEEEHLLVQFMKQVDDSSEVIRLAHYRRGLLLERLKSSLLSENGRWTNDTLRSVKLTQASPEAK